ncbi:MAG: hypothetical protein A2Y33_13280 [Spirochaetes bacterium GWF1_51_8]|nr:MAG: hypothetical protein A2Y33_13280 [Spirochaetes bacterium GWF1_51_8]
MRIVCLFLVFSAIFSGCSLSHVEYIPANPQNGIAFLSNSSMVSNTIVKLDGIWEFYWGRYLYPGDFILQKQTPDTYIKVPEVWNSFYIGGNQVPEQGYATYRLVLKNIPPFTNFALFINNVSVAYRLYIGGKLVGANGIAGTNKQTTVPFYYSMLYPFSTLDSEIEIIFHIANFHYTRGGLWHTPRFGKLEAVIHETGESFGMDYFILGALIIIGVYHLVIFLLRRDDPSSFFFFLLCISFSLRVLCTINYLITQFLPGIPWDIVVRFEYFSFIVPTVSFLLFLGSVLKEYVFRPFHYAIYGISGFFALLVVMTGVDFFTRYMFQYMMLVIAVVLYSLFVIIRAIVHKNRNAVYVLIGSLFMIVAVVNDILFYSYVFNAFGTLSPLGTLFFFFTQSIVLSIRFSKAFRTVETLTLNLEKKVLERTFALEKERNKLRLNNKMIEKEMSLARKIQNEFIPSETPLKTIAAYYKPMLAIGGDFYDFYRIEANKDLLGVFISDVSGHGIPAALVTSMIKSTLLQVAPYSTNPAKVMSYLNSAIFNMTAGNFVTAMYGILNYADGTFTYSNAGHVAPFILTPDAVLKMEGKHSPPLALFNNQQLKADKKFFKVNKVVLNHGAKILLYTDGLTEAVHIDARLTIRPENIIDFETAVLDRLLESSKNDSIHAIVNKLSNGLRYFRGSDEYDDDVCIIGLEI